MLRGFFEGLLAMPRLMRVMRSKPDVWSSFLDLTLKRTLVVLLLAGPFIGARIDELRAGPEDWWQWLVSFGPPLIVAQWIVVAFTREYDDRISDSLARRAGIPPEDAEPPTTPPRTRFDWKWVKKRMRRRMQVFRAALPGFILFAMFFSFFSDDFMLRAVSSGVGALWTFYWLVVGTVSKSASGWTTEGSAPPLLFIGALSRLPLVGWIGRLWSRMAKDLFPPAEMVERHPLEFIGLTLMRLTGVVPLVGLWWRPLVPVAVSSILQPDTPKG